VLTYIKAFLSLLSLIIFSLVINTPPPQSVAQINLTQFFSFFIPLFFFLVLLADIIYQYWVRSVAISIGILFLVLLWMLDNLNLITGVAIVFAIILVIKVFKKPPARNTIPKLTKLKMS
jgi:hypothetical protein